MKKIMAIALVLVMAVSLMMTAAMADNSNAAIPDATASDGTATVTLTAKNVTFQSAYIELEYDSSLTLTEVKASDGAKCVNEVTTAAQVEGETKMFAWNIDGGKAKIAYANGSDVTASSSGQAIFTFTFTGVTKDTEVKANIIFYNAEAGAATPVEITAETTGNIKASASGTVYKLGDVNHDGKVNRADRNLLIKFVAGLNPDGFFEAQADIDNSGKVNRADRNQLIKFTAGLPVDYPIDQ